MSGGRGSTSHQLDHAQALSATARASALRLGVLLLQAASSFALVPIAIALVGRESYGVWVVIRSFGSYVLLGAEIGLGQSVVNYTSRARANDDRIAFGSITATAFFIYIALAATILAGLAVLNAVLPLAPILAGHAADGHPEITPLLLLYCALALAAVPLNVFLAALVGLRRIVLRQALDASVPVLTFIAAVGALLVGFGTLGLVMATTATSIVVGLLAGIFALRSGWSSIEFGRARRELTNALLINSGFFLIYGAALTLQRTGGVLVISSAGALVDVPTMYVLTLAYRNMGLSILDAALRVSQPYLVALDTLGDTHRLASVTRVSTQVIGAAALTISTLALATGPWLMRLIGLPTSWWTFWLLGTALTVDALFLPAANALIALNRHRELSLGQLAYAIWSVILALTLIGAGVNDSVLSVAAALATASVGASALVMLPVVARGLRLQASGFVTTHIWPNLRIAGPALLMLAAVHAFTPTLDLAAALLVVIVVAPVSLRSSLTHSERSYIAGLLRGRL